MMHSASPSPSSPCDSSPTAVSALALSCTGVCGARHPYSALSRAATAAGLMRELPLCCCWLQFASSRPKDTDCTRPTLATASGTQMAPSAFLCPEAV